MFIDIDMNCEHKRMVKFAPFKKVTLALLILGAGRVCSMTIFRSLRFLGRTGSGVLRLDKAGIDMGLWTVNHMLIHETGSTHSTHYSPASLSQQRGVQDTAQVICFYWAQWEIGGSYSMAQFSS